MPNTLPMARLAQYMGDLAAILGEPDRVHFIRVEAGSVALVHVIEDEAIPKVEERIKAARHNEGPREPREAIRIINRHLKEDNGSAVLAESGGTEILRFPGREEEEEVSFGAFSQQDTLDGVVISIGGKNDPVPVHLEAVGTPESTYNCYARRSLAKELAKFLFGNELRVYGLARWLRSVDGDWDLRSFQIESFEPLNAQSLGSLVAKLRAIPGNEWNTLDDPRAELDQLRISHTANRDRSDKQN